MKVAITSTGDSTSATIDSRFGRCSYFVIYDTENNSSEIFKNPNKESVEGAGPASVQFLASKGAQKVVSGEFGAKVKTIFEQLQIQLIVMNDTNKTISEVISFLNQSNN